MATTFLAHILLWASVCGAIFGFGLTCRGLWCSDKNFYHPRWASFILWGMAFMAVSLATLSTLNAHWGQW